MVGPAGARRLRREQAGACGFDGCDDVPHARRDHGDRHKGAFIGWRTFNWHIAQRLILTDPLDFRPFEAWRARADRARLWTKRATDIAAGGQPPLKGDDVLEVRANVVLEPDLGLEG